MLAIKLQRIGKKHQPSYRLVVAEKRSKMIAPPVENLGFYNPFTKSFGIKKDRVEYWVSKGARPTVTAHNLFIEKGVLTGKKVAVKIKKGKTSAAEKTETPAGASEQAAAAVESVPAE